MARTCSLSYLGGWGRRIAWTREAEVAVSWDWVIALLGDRVRLSQNNKPKQNKKPKFQWNPLTSDYGEWDYWCPYSSLCNIFHLSTSLLLLTVFYNFCIKVDVFILLSIYNCFLYFEYKLIVKVENDLPTLILLLPVSFIAELSSSAPGV